MHNTIGYVTGIAGGMRARSDLKDGLRDREVLVEMRQDGTETTLNLRLFFLQPSNFEWQ